MNQQIFPPLPSLDSVREAVGDRSFSAGSAYVSQGRVMKAERLPGGDIRGQVRGSDRNVYEQSIVCKGGGLEEASCTCPVGNDCKHVAAVMVALFQREPPSGKVRAVAPAIARRPPAAPALPPAVAQWLAALERADAPEAPVEIAPDAPERIIYVLSGETSPLLPKTAGLQQLTARVVIGKLLKSGGISATARNFPTDGNATLDQMGLATPADKAILKLIRAHLIELRLIGAGYSYHQADIKLQGESGAAMLAAILATGRARHVRPDSFAIAAGPPRPAAFTWKELDDGGFAPAIALPGGGNGAQLYVAHRPLALDIVAGQLCELEFELPPAKVMLLLQAPPIPLDTARAVSAAFKARLPQSASFAPPEPPPLETIRAMPVPHLQLMGVDVKNPEFHRYGYGYGQRGNSEPEKIRIGVARVTFHYPEKARFGLSDERPSLRRRDGARLVEVLRDVEGEARQVEMLLECGFASLQTTRNMSGKKTLDDVEPLQGQPHWVHFLEEDMPGLLAAGWQIATDPSFPVRIVKPDADLDFGVSQTRRDSSGIDWFSLDCGVMVNGERIDLTVALASLIAKSDSILNSPNIDTTKACYLTLPDGRLLGLPTERVRDMLRGLIQLFDPADFPIGGKAPALRFRPDQAAALAALELAGGKWKGGERIRAMGQALRAHGGMPAIAPPANFHATLRPYQQTGLNWLSFLKDSGFGAILADDMGLGKTIQTLGLLAHEKAGGRLDLPALVVAPTSLVSNWQREAERFTPDLRVLVSHGTERKKAFGSFGEHDIVITSYPLIARDHAVLAKQEWSMLILDEAQTLKNPAADVTQRIDGLDAGWRLALSGTPIENNLTELWSLFHLLNKGLLGDRKAFQTRFRNPIEKKGDKTRTEALNVRVKPFILRRTKEQVATDLPAKTEITEEVELDSAQRDLYETIRLAMQKKVREALAAQGLAKSHIILLDALLKLRQAALDPRLVKGGLARNIERDRTPSAKLDRLMDLLATLRDEDRRVVVFSQFTSMLDLIEPRLREAELGFVRLDGDSKDRGAIVKRFQTGAVPVFLASLKAGGVGLNLTAADTVILFDPWWNPAVEDQAVDRVHRIGQQKPIFVHRLVAKGTIEEKMDALKEKKRAIAASIFDADGQIMPALTEGDVLALLAG